MEKTHTYTTAGPGFMLELIRSEPAWTRAHLVAESGLARATVAERLAALSNAGLIVDGPHQSTRGRPAELFSFNTKGGYLLVADIGGSHTRTGITDLGGTLLSTRDVDLDIDEGPEFVLSTVLDQFDDLLASVDGDPARVRGIGMGVPGPVDFETGRLVRPRAMKGWDGVIVPDRVRTRFDVTIVADQDANIMALGEHRTTWPQHLTMLTLKVGMGIGCGIIADGAVLHGAQGAAGDIGHISLGGDELCRCGQRGCVEAIAGGRAIAARLAERGKVVRTSQEIVELTLANDADAVALVRDAGRVIGQVLSNVISVINPSLVVVGGNLGESRGPLLAGIREVVYQQCHPLATQALQLVSSRIGPAAGLAGAASMVLDTLLAPAAVDRVIRDGAVWK